MLSFKAQFMKRNKSIAEMNKNTGDNEKSMLKYLQLLTELLYFKRKVPKL